MISQETVLKVKQTANLIEVIGESVSLKRQGRNFMGLCPFHSEKSPSFMIRDSGEGYYCFGCGASGNVISFIMQTQGLTFPEAIEELASRYGIEVIYEKGNKVINTINFSESIYKANYLALQYFQKQLKTGPILLKKYLEDRLLDLKVIGPFGIGFAPDEWSALSQFLISQKIDEEILIKAGLCQRNQSGKLIDRFRGRLIFPIFVDPKRIAGFGGRIVPGLVDLDREKKAPKYLNSPETEVYKKSKILYGLPQASRKIREMNSVYLVEGYVDVIGFWKVGIENTVATCGTSVTDEHMKRLSQLAKRLIVVFDGDDAGRAAAAKMYPITINTGIDVSAVFLGQDQDPDTFAALHGADTENVLSEQRTLPLFECYIESLIQKYGGGNIKSLGAVSKGKIAVELSLLIGRVANEIEKSSLVDSASQKLQINTKQFQEMVSKPIVANSRFIKNPTTLQNENIDETKKNFSIRVKDLPNVDRDLIRAVIAKKELASDVTKNPNIHDSAHPETFRFLSILKVIFETDVSDEIKKKEIKDLLNTYGPDWLEFWKESHHMANHPGVKIDQLFEQCLKAYQKNQLERIVGDINNQILDSDDETQRINLEEQRRKINQQIVQARASSTR